MKKKSTDSIPQDILRAHEFRATPIRIALIELFSTTSKPLTIAQVIKKLRRTGGDTATIYRAVHALVDTGILRQLSLIEGVSSYDLATSTPHSHHIVCDVCNAIERIPFCVRGIETSAKAASKLFKSISMHNLSFSGTCKKCARAVR